MLEHHSSGDLLSGPAFTVAELDQALAWPSWLPLGGVKVVVATNYAASPEVLEVFRPEAEKPNWLVFKDLTGKTVVGVHHYTLRGCRTQEWHAFECLHDALEAISLQLIEGA